MFRILVAVQGRPSPTHQLSQSLRPGTPKRQLGPSRGDSVRFLPSDGNTIPSPVVDQQPSSSTTGSSVSAATWVPWTAILPQRPQYSSDKTSLSAPCLDRRIGSLSWKYYPSGCMNKLPTTLLAENLSACKNTSAG